MWFTLLFIMIFIYIGLGIIQKLIDIFRFYNDICKNKNATKNATKKKLIK